jgi:NADP-dependent 3-hydroxy acid dehydrogenase YdfG
MMNAGGNMGMNIDGKVVVIRGASSGLGQSAGEVRRSARVFTGRREGLCGELLSGKIA